MVFTEIVPKFLHYAEEAILVVATNPMDIMTHIASEIAGKSGVATRRVLGSGTTLDTARFRSLLGQHFDVDSHHVHAYVVGEHGDSEVLTWSMATIGGVPLDEFRRLRNIGLDTEARQCIDEGVRRAAYRIIEGKRATYYGIGSAIARIVDAVLHNQRSIVTICSRLPKVLDVPDVTLSIPHIVGGEGVLESLPLVLDAEENLALRGSAALLRDAWVTLGSVDNWGSG